MTNFKNKNLYFTLKNSINGFIYLLNEKSIKRELMLLMIISSIAIYYPNFYTLLLLILTLVLIAVESINTAIENICDFLTKDVNLDIKKIKDICSFSVLIIITCIVIFFIYILLNYDKIFIIEEKNKSIIKTLLIIQSKPGAYLIYASLLLLSYELYLKNKKIKTVIIILIAIFWILFFNSLISFFNNIGVDSLIETKNFHYGEALFWLSTFITSLNLKISLREFLLYNFIVLIIYLTISNFLNKILKNCSYIIAFTLFIFGLTFTFYKLINLYIKNSDNYNSTARNFIEKKITTSYQKKLNVFLYIGESTTTLNMGVYGYPRETTPLLAKIKLVDDGLLIFNNVLSTHTHTSLSLLEALSVGINISQNNLPIYKRERVPISSILKENNIKTVLYSNQGYSGASNKTSSVIFKNSDKFFSTNNRHLGDSDSSIEKPFDNVYFDEVINKELLNLNETQFIAFHSYAGHGNYLLNIPKEFRKKVDNFYDHENIRSIIGNNLSYDINVIENYDSAIRYIDYSVSNAIEKIRDSNKPWVLIYTSDHGESVFSNRGHDSSRYTHEMVRVPFLLYFNAKAKKEYPELYAKYKKLTHNNRISTLAQLPFTIFDLIGISVDSSMNVYPPIGNNSIPQSIVVRETPAGTFSKKLYLNREDFSGHNDIPDLATDIFVANSNKTNPNLNFCYHRSNSITKALRGSIVTDCLEIDITIESNGNLMVNHPPAHSSGLSLESLKNALKKYNNISLWLDMKNFDSKEQCNILYSFISKKGFTNGKYLIELPSYSHKISSEIFECVNNIKSLGNIYFAYYLPTNIAVDCAHNLKKGIQFNKILDCQKLNADFILAKKSKIFSDISFDYSSIEAIKYIDPKNDFTWNSWNIDVQELNLIDLRNFRMLIPVNNDINNR